MSDYQCPECKSEKLDVSGKRVACLECGREYVVHFGEVPDFAPVEGFHDSAAHSYTYSYSSRFYESVRRSVIMKLTTGVSFEEETKLLFDCLGLQDGIRILDVACGTGIFSRQFATKFNSIEAWGLDYSYSQLRRAVAYRKQARISNLKFVHGLATKLPFPSGGFDRVATVGAMQFFGDFQLFFNEAFRVLKPGGILVAMNYLDLNYKPSEHGIVRRVQGVAARRGDHFFSKPEVLEYAAKAGFVDTRYEERDIVFALAVNKQ